LNIERLAWNIQNRINIASPVIAHQPAASRLSLLIGIVQKASAKVKAIVVGIKQEGAMYLGIEGVSPALGIQAGKYSGSGIESIEQIAIDGIETTINIAIARIESD
jgi:hypothetical protein